MGKANGSRRGAPPFALMRERRIAPASEWRRGGMGQGEPSAWQVVGDRGPRGACGWSRASSPAAARRSSPPPATVRPAPRVAAIFRSQAPAPRFRPGGCTVRGRPRHQPPVGWRSPVQPDFVHPDGSRIPADLVSAIVRGAVDHGAAPPSFTLEHYGQLSNDLAVATFAGGRRMIVNRGGGAGALRPAFRLARPPRACRRRHDGRPVGRRRPAGARTRIVARGGASLGGRRRRTAYGAGPPPAETELVAR